MSPRLISRSPDLRRLRDEGYEVAVVDGHLVVTSVPYLNATREAKLGTLVSELTLAGDVTTRPGDHVVRFAGEQPCDVTGHPLTKLINANVNEEITAGLRVNFMFSAKPEAGFYCDYYQKITTYVAILGTAVAAVDPGASARTFRVIDNDDPESVFHYLDTASSRADITMINAKLAVDRVAIIGLGGTGAYTLDLLAKTPVREIHLYDGDFLLQHNPFRGPGAASIEDLRNKPTKVDYYAEMYSAMRRGIMPHPHYVDENNVTDLQAMSFAFVCIDDGPTKPHLLKALEGFGVSYIDVGMGIYRADGALAGQVRTTTSTPGQRQHVWDQRRRIPFDQAADDDYDTNIQVADLNALNAVLAVIKWKKLCGFYADLTNEHHSIFTLATNSMISDDRA